MSTATAKKKKAPPAAARTTLRSWEWIAEQVGTPRWCVAARLTERLKLKGYECAIPLKKYRAYNEAWERAFYGAPLSSLHEAAPEMYAMLEELQDQLKWRQMYVTREAEILMHEKIDAVLKKARGEK